MAKTLWHFDHSECNRVNLHHDYQCNVPDNDCFDVPGPTEASIFAFKMAKIRSNALTTVTQGQTG